MLYAPEECEEKTCFISAVDLHALLLPEYRRGWEELISLWQQRQPHKSPSKRLLRTWVKELCLDLPYEAKDDLCGSIHRALYYYHRDGLQKHLIFDDKMPINFYHGVVVEGSTLRFPNIGQIAFTGYTKKRYYPHYGSWKVSRERMKVTRILAAIFQHAVRILRVSVFPRKDKRGNAIVVRYIPSEDKDDIVTCERWDIKEEKALAKMHKAESSVDNSPTTKKKKKQSFTDWAKEMGAVGMECFWKPTSGIDWDLPISAEIR